MALFIIVMPLLLRVTRWVKAGRFALIGRWIAGRKARAVDLNILFLARTFRALVLCRRAEGNPSSSRSPPSSSCPGRQLAAKVYAWPPRRWGFNASPSLRPREKSQNHDGHARDGAKGYTVLVYEPRSRASSLQNLSDEVAARLCPRGIPNYDVERTALFSLRWTWGRAERLRDVKRASRIALSSPSSERQQLYSDKSVFALSPRCNLHRDHPGWVFERTRNATFKDDIWSADILTRYFRRSKSEYRIIRWSINGTSYFCDRHPSDTFIFCADDQFA